MVKMKKIADFTNVITGGTPSTRKPEYWNGSIPWLNSGVLNEGDINKATKFITELGLEKSAARIMPKDTVLIALTGATTGQIGYLNFDASANQSVTGILPSKEHYPRYLYYFLRTQREKIKADTFGGGQPHINQKYVKDFIVPLPLLDDQIRIATLLSKVESLITKRKKSITDLDELLKSTFLEMFDGFAENKQGYPLKKLKKFITHITSGGRGWAKYYSESGKRFIRSLDVQMNKIGNDDVVYVTPPNNKEAERTKVETGDVLLTITGSKIGRVSFVPEDFDEAYISQHVAIIRTTGINPVYLSYYLSMPNSGQLIIKRKQYGQAKPGLNLTQIKNFEILNPSPKLQNQFADIVEKVESIKVKYQNSLNDIETLYGALSQKAFNGELDLSRIPLVHELKAKDIITGAPQIGKPALTVQNDPKKELVSREQTLNQLFQSYIADLKTGCFSLDDFWVKAEEKFMETMDEEDPPLGMKEYDQVKTWLFELLASGKALQVFNEIENRMEIRMAS